MDRDQGGDDYTSGQTDTPYMLHWTIHCIKYRTINIGNCFTLVRNLSLNVCSSQTCSYLVTHVDIALFHLFGIKKEMSFGKKQVSAAPKAKSSSNANK